jgi:hypothetical protein
LRAIALEPTFDYLVDFRQRVAERPASRVAELTPRLWKRHVAANRLRSDLQAIAYRARTRRSYR